MADQSAPPPNPPEPPRRPGEPPVERTILGLPVLAFFLILTPLAVVAFVGVCTAVLDQRG